MNRRNGISLIVLIITIIVIIIISSAIILTISNNGVIDQSKKAKFMSDFTNVAEGVNLYSISNFNEATGEFVLPLKAYLTDLDKTYIINSVPTLHAKIEELSGDISAANLAWISSEDINITLPVEKREKGYIIDVNSKQIYDYIGDIFDGKRWHTLEGGIDIAGPAIDIQIISEQVLGTSINISLNYKDPTLKQYKIGTSNLTWSTYTSEFEISSYTVLANNWQNDDGTVTLYTKGKDMDGNEIIIEKKITSLDLDKPILPVITSNSGYPSLTVYGVLINAPTTITYDTRTDIDNYYSLDNGVSWNIYTGSISYVSGSIIAKSVKKESELEVVVSKTIIVSSDSIKAVAYDGNINTSYVTTDIATTHKMHIDSEMIGKNISIVATIPSPSYNDRVFAFVDINGNVLQTMAIGYDKTEMIHKVPVNAYRLVITSTYSIYSIWGVTVYEIKPELQPEFIVGASYYPTIFPTGVKPGYASISIKYYPTSVQKLYRVGTTGNWLNYNDSPVEVNSGAILYAKGIDQYGNETKIPSYTAPNVSDAMKSQSYDGDITTYFTTEDIKTPYKIYIDSSMIGRNISVIATLPSPQYNDRKLMFRDINRNIISIIDIQYTPTKMIYTVPANAYTLEATSSYSLNYVWGINVYEISPEN